MLRCLCQEDTGLTLRVVVLPPQARLGRCGGERCYQSLAGTRDISRGFECRHEDAARQIVAVSPHKRHDRRTRGFRIGGSLNRSGDGDVQQWITVEEQLLVLSGHRQGSQRFHHCGPVADTAPFLRERSQG